MDIAFLLGTKIIELTLIVLIGYGLVKSKLLKSEDSKPLSIIGLYVISPAVMIEAFQIDYTPEILQGLQLSLLMAVFLQGILIIIGSLLKRLLNLDPIEHATSIYSNSGNLIIPIVMSLFGKEWVIYASCFIVVQTFLFWTHCRLIIVGKGNLSLKTIAKISIFGQFSSAHFYLLFKLSCQTLSMAHSLPSVCLLARMPCLLRVC